MASTSIATVGEMVVVTQLIPKDQKSIPLQTPTKSEEQKAPSSAPKHPTKVDDMTTAFLRGEPMSLGIVQIFIGLLCILFSLVAFYSPPMLVCAPFGFAVAFVVSGSLAVAARKETSLKLVWASLVSHVVSVLFSLAGSAYLCWMMAVHKIENLICDPPSFWNFNNPDDVRMSCLSKLWYVEDTLYGVQGVLLVLLLLQFCVAITICVFSGRAIRRHKHYSPIKVEVDDCPPLDSEDLAFPQKGLQDA